MHPLLRHPSELGPNGCSFEATVRGGLLASTNQPRPWCVWSAACASCVIYAKNAGDWPMKRPMFVRNVRAPIAMPPVLVGRIIETMGRLGSKNGHGSGMIKFVWKSSPPNGGEFRSGNVTCTPVTGSTTSGIGGALPALSDHV